MQDCNSDDVLEAMSCHENEISRSSQNNFKKLTSCKDNTKLNSKPNNTQRILALDLCMQVSCQVAIIIFIYYIKVNGCLNDRRLAIPEAKECVKDRREWRHIVVGDVGDPG